MSENTRQIQFRLNGKSITVDCDPTRRLLDVLRDDLHLTGTKEGCGIGECGACTVVLDDQAVASCLVPVGQVNGRSVLTVEGLSEQVVGRVLQKCFVGETPYSADFVRREC
jgi:carbon-monoxide dehydrogenase small subunit